MGWVLHTQRIDSGRGGVGNLENFAYNLTKYIKASEGAPLLDVAKGEMVEMELDNFTERRSQKADPGEETSHASEARDSGRVRLEEGGG